jgi:hypothetical protein
VLDAGVLMLRGAVERGAAISDSEQHDMAFFDARCAVVLHTMERASRQAAEEAAAARQFPPNLTLSDFDVRNPAVTPPAAATAPALGDGLVQRLKREMENIGWLPAPLANAASFGDSEVWLAQPQLRHAVARGDEAAEQLVLATVERLVYTRTLALAEGWLVGEQEVLALESLVERYRIVLRGFAGRGARKLAELRSRETLVVWAAFCLVHDATQREFPLLGGYGVALDPHELRHLVLADRLAVDALRRVARYLQVAGWGVKPCVFSLRGGDRTMEMARHCAEALPDMVALWGLEEAAARARRVVHWDEVQRKQRRIEELSGEVRRLEAQERAHDVEAATHAYHSYHARSARSESEGIRRRINSKNAEIERERHPPDPVLQPLPSVRSKAMPVIFFLKMPRRFQV